MSQLTSTAEETDQQLSETTLNKLPLEVLDIILENSLLDWVLSSWPDQRDDDVISSLACVDFCWFQRIKKPRFRKRLRQRLKDFYTKTTRGSAIIRYNRSFLLENIDPSDKLIEFMLSLSCITEEQRQFIQRKCSKRRKNEKMLYCMRTRDQTKSSNFVRCLRQTNQMTAARILENGGVVIKVEVQNRDAKCTLSVDTQLLVQVIEDLRRGAKPRSHQTDKLISQLKDEGIEILNSQLERQTVVIWIWCQSQAALETIQKLYESNQLTEVLFLLANIQPSSLKIIQSKVINIDCNQFKKTVVVCPISVSLTKRIDVNRNETAHGVTKLRNEFYVIYAATSSSPDPVICVFEDRHPFRLQRKIEIKEICSDEDIVSSENENCLFVRGEKCAWKITRETNGQHKIIKWLTIDHSQRSLSVGSAGQLLMVGYWSSILSIYGSDATFIRSIQFSTDIKELRHAVETSIGNFIILHKSSEEEYEKVEEKSNAWGEVSSTWRRRANTWRISEVTSDGQMTIRCFIPPNETQQLEAPEYLSLDSDDRVFVADQDNHRVILLDSDLKWNRIICPTKQEQEQEQGREVEERNIYLPLRLCYDEDMKQLIVAGYFQRGINVYTLGRI